MQLFSADIQKTAMIRKLLLFCFVALTLSAFAQPCTIEGVFDYGMAKDLVERLNKVRKLNHLQPMTMERDLTEAAMLRAAELATQWDMHVDLRGSGPMRNHQRPNGTPFYTIVEEKYAPKKFDSEVLGEVFVCGVASDVWRGEQRTAIIKDQKTRGKWTTAGAGVCYSGGKIFWVVLYTKTGNGNTTVPDGQWKVQVQVDTFSGGSTKILSQEATDNLQLSKSVEITVNFLYDKAAEIVPLVNKDRRAENLPPLTMDSALTHCAMLRAAELSTGTSCISTITQKYGSDYYDARITHNVIYDYSHVRPNLESYSRILKDGSNHYENLAYNYYDAQKVETDWMNSPGHRRSILQKNTKLIGVGVVDSPNGRYLIQYFSDGKLTKKCHSKAHEKATVQISLNPEVPTRVLKKKRIE